jgi:glycosyltransferase involved in cell wall biosynthesis
VRVLVASGTWPPEQNGVARVAVETARWLARRGHEITVLAPRGVDCEAVVEDGRVQVLPALERGRLPLVLTDVIQSRRHARSLAGRFDVAVAHGSMLGAGLSLAKLGAPVVLVYHASLAREFRFARGRLPPGRARLAAYVLDPPAALVDRAAVRAADRILVLSKFSRSLLEQDHRRADLAKIRVVSGGVDVDVFSPEDGPAAARGRLGLDRSARLLVTVRRAEPRMGIEQLIAATSRLLPSFPDLTLAVVGGGILEPRLRALSAELGIAERVRFPGRVGDSELRDWYRAADLFVLPTVAYEGFGMVTAEALACGSPVVGTPVGATPELLAPLDERLVAPGSTAEDLAGTIAGTLVRTDAELRARCRAYACSRLAWSTAIAAWEAALVEAAAA